MTLSIFSEIGQLKQVMVHAPGPEVDRMVPDLMHELLFDDIIYGDTARAEHASFCACMQKFGVEVFDILQLFEEALSNATHNKIYELVRSVQKVEWHEEDIIEELLNLEIKELARTLIEGKVNPNRTHLVEDLYTINPLPNLMFVRDPIFILHDRIISCAMSNDARQREALIARFVFSNHPEFQCDSFVADFAKVIHSDEKPIRGVLPDVEGGDILVLDEKTIAMGWSERTNERAIELVGRLLKERTQVENLIMVCLPDRRSVMHLDTVFTRISKDECLIYPPMFLKDGIERVTAIHFDLTRDAKALHGEWHSSFLPLLEKIGLDLKPICCGGPDDLISQQREQWTDGANAFCLAPGIIMMYRRNDKTLKELEKAGYQLLEEETILSPNFKPDFNKKTVIMIEGNELSRARGGPRCLTQPLVRAK